MRKDPQKMKIMIYNGIDDLDNDLSFIKRVKISYGRFNFIILMCFTNDSIHGLAKSFLFSPVNLTGRVIRKLIKVWAKEALSQHKKECKKWVKEKHINF